MSESDSSRIGKGKKRREPNTGQFFHGTKFPATGTKIPVNRANNKGFAAENNRKKKFSRNKYRNMEHPNMVVVRFKRWLNAVFEAWIEKRPLYVIVVSFFYHRAISLRFVPPPPPPPRELTRVTFRDHLHTHLYAPIVSPIRARATGFEPLSYFLPGSINKIWLR